MNEKFKEFASKLEDLCNEYGLHFWSYEEICLFSNKNENKTSVEYYVYEGDDYIESKEVKK